MLSATAIAANRVINRLGVWPGHGRALILAGGGLLAAAVVAITITVWDLRAIVVADALLNTENLAIVLAEQTSHSVHTVDIVLRDVQERIVALGVSTPEEFRGVLQTQEINEFLRSRVDRLPQIDSIALIGANGARVNNSLAWPVSSADLSDRDYTRHFVAQDDPGLFVSDPVVSRATGARTLFLVRRVNGPRGEFLGMVLASVPLKIFHELYQSINLPQSESIVLVRRDGTVLVRNLEPTDRPAGMKMPADSAWHTLVSQGGGHYESPGVFDATTRMVTVQPLRDYPLVMDVGLTKDMVLSHWRREATLIASGTATAVGCILLMLHRLRLQFHRLERSKSILTIRNADLTRAAEALQASETHLATTAHELEITLASMGQGLVMVDAGERVAVCNRRAIEMLDLSGPLMASRPRLDAVPALQWIASELGLPKAVQGPPNLSPILALPRTRERELPNGLIVEVGCLPLASGDGWVVTCQDITARRQAEQQVVFMARHDVLTRLPNRVVFRERIELAIAQTDRAIAAAVLFLDLDHFKAVNDTLGHPVGDGLLCAVADRLEASVRQVDTIARFGGDEFAVVQVGPERIEDVAVLAQRIGDVLSASYEVGGHQVIVGVSIGIALVPLDGSDPDTLLKNADIALYRAKAEGRGVFRFFEPAMDAHLQERRTLELDLHRALAAHEFELFYQPLVSAASERICGFEALMRWNHPSRGLLKPETFIAIVEEMGLIVPLGRWALQEACREAATWPDDVKVAVNLSAVQFNSHDLVQAVSDALASSGLPARRLNLEITESVMLQNTEEVLGILRDLRKLGASISMDDFGTGYSSLSYLRSFPFDKIKIDQSFIRDLARNEDAAAIVRAVTSLGSALGMATTAEGVETLDQFRRLRAEGCTEVQGYFFSKAAPAAEVPRLLRQFHSDKMQATWSG